MGPVGALRRLDERLLGAAPQAASRRASVLPYVLVGIVLAGGASLVIVLSGGSLVVAALLPALALLPPGIALLNRPAGGRHRHR